MYPKQQKNPTPEAELVKSIRDNPEAAAARGNFGVIWIFSKKLRS
jgi:hypothetical protein